MEIAKNNINFDTQKEVKIEYSDIQIRTHRLDTIVVDQIIVEMKAA